MLCNGLRRLPHITSLTILDTFDGFEYIPSRCESYFWYEHKFSRGRSPALQPSRWNEDLRDTGEPNGRLSGLPWDCRGVVSLIRAVSMSQLVIKELIWVGLIECTDIDFQFFFR